MFTFGDVIKIFNLERERLREWLKLGFFSYAIKPKGKGGRGLFGHTTVVEIGIFLRLVTLGFHRKKAIEIVNKIEVVSEMPNRGYLFCCGHLNIMWKDDSKHIFVMAVPIEDKYRPYVGWESAITLDIQMMMDSLWEYKDSLSEKEKKKRQEKLLSTPNVIKGG
jgi:hypothetical protein